MTLNELIIYLDAHAGFDLLDGMPEDTLERARRGAHRHAIAGEIIAALGTLDAAGTGQGEVERSAAVKALSPLRLKYMADDAPVEGFRMVEKIITTIDEGFNEEALGKRG
ncbi:hypothetical protein CKO35_04605 [Ectothiorhodospira shaposhnikovii]|uniref:hypothetical protein n=1 Tax=Ectothiorhodospira shaposhnikovii TaxID=1054 RepID=UPI001903F518|nr:hypothetical protein [Ectothiorhodospira shaposhnikovii]MBK1672590.1 hypothetical protein [Ectothiorhodospira shaposhnikovii]